MSGVVAGFTVIFLVVGIGYLLGRSGTLGPAATEVLSRLVFFVCTPALLFSALVAADLRQVFSSTLVIAAGTALTIGLVYALAARLWWRRAVPELVIGALSSSYVNSVNLGVPIAMYVLDDRSFIAPLLLFQIVVYSPIALVALDLSALRSAAGGLGGRRVWRDAVLTPLSNPILLGGVAGLVVAGLHWHPPKAVMDPFRMLGDASVPLALLVFGLSLAARRASSTEDGDTTSKRDVALAAVLKMLAMPALAYALSRWGFGLSGHHLFAQVVIAALPTAQNVLVYAVRYQRGQALARDSALVTTLASIPVIAFIAVTLG
ncbi:AEC family transporter [Gordonia sp. X0973]|uniref:AEC family transporter n=1 Tax=Gordonia sp. X0973 TaxID=2742602 RepID=UPI000F52BC4A|nr:AEC family transporter [Gordonia sp. X0973]QKT06437.1 AEC family transporter [Gordonia sp. X0973]